MHDQSKEKPKQPKGLLEQSNPRYDLPAIRVGPLEFIANYQHPPIDRRTRIVTIGIVACTIFIGYVGWIFLTPLRPKLPFAAELVLFAVACSIVVELISRLVLFGWWRTRGFRREQRLLPDLIGHQSIETTPPRIVIRGRPSELIHFASQQDEFFEPQVYCGSHQMFSMRLENRVYFAVVLFLLLLASLAVPKYGILIFLVTAPLLYLIVRGIPDKPTYYRFVPGRLDVLWFPWIRRGKATAWMVNLRDVIIQVDLTSRQEMIIIASRVEPVVFRRDNLPDPLNFSLALIRAALSTATPPPLPMDALTG